MITPQEMIARGALVVVNHSGGKDSQALLIKMLEVVPKGQLLVVHASLGDIEWKGALELARDQAADAGVPFLVARSHKTLLDMVEKRFRDRPEVPSFPSAKYRQCTSDLKRDPIKREVIRWAKQAGFSLILNAEGIRAAESPRRAKCEVFKFHPRNSVAGRTWFDWLPIHALSTTEVFATIAQAGQTPHWAYGEGNERLSCVFCIMGSVPTAKNGWGGDIANGARLNPELFARYVELEERTGYAMHESRLTLTEIVAKAQRLALAA
jgi:3'-phosphoadenosine 5'-phosphosulfate sulfotransferase (PAPS reductase)/FAD synthetase